MAEAKATVQDLLKRTAVALKQGDVPFALCGGYAAWVYGGPEPDHDADFVVRTEHAERVADVLVDAGLPVVHPAEDWLLKVETPTAFVDVIWRACGEPVHQDLLERAETRSVLSVLMPVLAPTDVVVTKLNALDEHYCDYGRLLPMARAMREQVDWDRVRKEVSDNPFAATFLVLLERLDVVHLDS
ncbi:MAG: hypothetical protein ACTHK1_16740 [Actinomycetales bacterium]